MSSLGEKLRTAREARGVSISEIADQTRISSYYLEAIESDDYRVLPGGIFNKGFVKAFAKYVGVDEQEALQDYGKLIAEQGDKLGDVEKPFQRPEVLTDGGRGSMLPTLIFAAVILGLMTWGILAAVSWYNENQKSIVATSVNNNTKSANVSSLSAAANQANTSNSNTVNSSANTNSTTSETPAVTDGLNIQFKSISTELEKPNITSTVDGTWESYTFQGDEPKVYNPKESMKLTISKWQIQNLQLSINGKPITLPASPLNPTKKNGIYFEINKLNIASILQAGAVTVESLAFAAPNVNANTASAGTNTAVKR
jgi:cytoskeletal protein RodZ